MLSQAKRNESYFGKLVDRAGSRLTDDRPASAIRVRDAGGDAIHNLSKFKMKYPENKALQILDDTRKVLLDVYGTDKLSET